MKMIFQQFFAESVKNLCFQVLVKIFTQFNTVAFKRVSGVLEKSTGFYKNYNKILIFSKEKWPQIEILVDNVNIYIW